MTLKHVLLATLVVLLNSTGITFSAAATLNREFCNISQECRYELAGGEHLDIRITSLEPENKYRCDLADEKAKKFQGHVFALASAGVEFSLRNGFLPTYAYIVTKNMQKNGHITFTVQNQSSTKTYQFLINCKKL